MILFVSMALLDFHNEGERKATLVHELCQLNAQCNFDTKNARPGPSTSAMY